MQLLLFAKKIPQKETSHVLTCLVWKRGISWSSSFLFGLVHGLISHINETVYRLNGCSHADHVPQSIIVSVFFVTLRSCTMCVRFKSNVVRIWNRAESPAMYWAPCACKVGPILCRKFSLCLFVSSKVCMWLSFPCVSHRAALNRTNILRVFFYNMNRCSAMCGTAS
jgi:hypothetical protein